MAKISYPFAAVPNQIIRGGHGIRNVAVLTALLSHGKTTCSISTLARELGCDKKTILPGIRYWIEHGMEEGIEIIADESLGRPTVYEIVIHEMREPHPKTGQVEYETSPENGSGGDPKTGDLPHPKTGHKEEPLRRTHKKIPPTPQNKNFVDKGSGKPEPDHSRMHGSRLESVRDVLEAKGLVKKKLTHSNQKQTV